MPYFWHYILLIRSSYTPNLLSSAFLMYLSIQPTQLRLFACLFSLACLYSSV